MNFKSQEIKRVIQGLKITYSFAHTGASYFIKSGTLVKFKEQHNSDKHVNVSIIEKATLSDDEFEVFSLSLRKLTLPHHSDSYLNGFNFLQTLGCF